MNGQTYFNSNLMFLSDIDTVFPLQNTTAVSLIPSRRGPVTGRLNDLLLHSQFDPLREAERFVEGHSIKVGEHIFLYGFGIGYHVIEIARAIGKNGHLTIMELNPDILSAGLSSVDLRDLWTICPCTLLFADNESDALHKIHHSLADKSLPNRLIVHPPSFKCIPEQFQTIASLIEMELSGEKTQYVFKEKYLENFEFNIATILKSSGIDYFSGMFQNKPIFLVGAGPSFDNSVSVLHTFQDSAYICAVDTAFPLLQETGIRPDFVVSVDPQNHSARHFRSGNSFGIPIIVSPVSNHHVIAKHPGPFIAFLQKNHSFTKKFEHLLADKGISMAGGSVSCIALDIMLQFGFSTVLFVGMDFSYPNMKAYASNSMESLQLFHHTHKFNTLEMLHRKRIYAEKTLPALDYKNAHVLSSPHLCSYRKNIENLVEIYHKKVTFYSLAMNGARIAGVQPITERQLCSVMDYCTIDKKVCVPVLPVNHIKHQQILIELESMKHSYSNSKQ
ncbi:MAG: motility associated factor glycosyltransferase family protein [bacterium]|nr:motility associated factor glycosyltransferase family protein [bacterium]